jgi:hypothetical protein
MSDSLRVMADSVADTAAHVAMAVTDSTTVVDTVVSTATYGDDWIGVFLLIHSFVFLIALFETVSFVIGVFRKKKGVPNDTVSPENRPHGLIKELLWVFAIILPSTVISLLSNTTVSTNDFFSRLLITMGVFWLCAAIFFFTEFMADRRNNRRRGLRVYIDKFFKELLWVSALIYSSSWIATEFADICCKTDFKPWYTWQSSVTRWVVDIVITSIIAVKVVLVIRKYKKNRNLSHSKD